MSLHGYHCADDELESMHQDTTHDSVVVDLVCLEIERQEAAHVLEDAIFGLQKVHPGQHIQDKIAFDIVCLL